ncbi:MAG: outer membrane beta-barrel protein [Cucumibacter sp.]
MPLLALVPALLLGSTATSPHALAEDFSRGVATDNPALLYPPFAGRCIDSQGNIAPCPEAVNCVPDTLSGGTSGCASGELVKLRVGEGPDEDPGSLFEVTWSLTKSFARGYSAGGAPRSLAEVRSEAELFGDGIGADLTANIGSDLRYLPGGGDPYVSSFDAGLIGDFALNSLTSAFVSGSVEGSIPDPDDAGLPSGTAVPPLLVEWRGEAGLRQRLGMLSAEARANVLRETVSETVLDDSTVLDNSEFGRSAYGANGRLGLDLTPVLGVFVDASWRREAFDAASTGFGVPLDNVTSRTEAGITFEQGDDLNGEMSLGVLRRGFDDGSLTDVTTFLADASLNWSPNRTTTLSASVSTDLSPTTEPGATTDISRLASLEAFYAATDTLRLRGGVEFGRDEFADLVEETSTTTVGVGVDYLLNRFTTMFANLTGKAIADTTDGESQSLAIEAGITFSR